MSVEEWRDIPGFEGCYQASTLGNIRSLDRMVNVHAGGKRLAKGRTLKQKKTKTGYMDVTLSVGGTRTHRHVHQLVALTFLKHSDGMVVCHNDGNPQNNLLSNLRYDTHSANIRDKRLHGTDFNLNKTHCKWGHEFTPYNTYVYGTSRQCRACHISRALARQKRSKVSSVS